MDYGRQRYIALIEVIACSADAPQGGWTVARVVAGLLATATLLAGLY